MTHRPGACLNAIHAVANAQFAAISHARQHIWCLYSQQNSLRSPVDNHQALRQTFKKTNSCLFLNSNSFTTVARAGLSLGENRMKHNRPGYMIATLGLLVGAGLASAVSYGEPAPTDTAQPE